SHLDAAVFTHSHSDHVMGFDDLRRFTVMEDEELPVFALDETLDRLKTAFPYVFDGENRYRGYLKIQGNKIDGPFRVKEFEFTPLPVEHGKVETIGFLVSRDSERLFAYIPDAKTLHPETVAAIDGIDLLILDGLQPGHHWTHLSIPEAVDIAGEAKAKSTWLTHMSCQVDYKLIEPTLPDSVRLAWDGLEIQL
ncbi:MAG: MBL fold metallo-hydrolase, partial [Verrucomicrobiota bacterium]